MGAATPLLLELLLPVPLLLPPLLLLPLPAPPLLLALLVDALVPLPELDPTAVLAPSSLEAIIPESGTVPPLSPAEGTSRIEGA